MTIVINLRNLVSAKKNFENDVKGHFAMRHMNSAN